MPSERQYELVYIVTPVATDAEVGALQTEIDGHIQALGGAVQNTDIWGRRKLAYPVGHYGEGIYVAQLIDGPAGMVSELERRLRVRDQVLRHLIVRIDEDMRKTRRVAEKRKATVDKRRAARGLPPRAVAAPVAEGESVEAAVARPSSGDSPAEAVASATASEHAPAGSPANAGSIDAAAEAQEVKE